MTGLKELSAYRLGKGLLTAALLLLTAVSVRLWYGRTHGMLQLLDAHTGRSYGSFPVKVGDSFRIGFIHSVNKSPVIDCYRIRRDGIYVESTIYYSFGAGVQTELEEGQTLSYGEDGSMIVSGFDRRMEDLIYFVGTVSDHTLTLPKEDEVSLRSLCGRSSEVRFRFCPCIG